MTVVDRDGDVAPRLAERRILLDCRWLGRGGAGRATELLLRGLQELQPPGRWILWGPEAVNGFLWDGARHRAHRGSPLALFGQRDVLAVPAHDVAVYMHQIRPLRPGSSVTLIHDTIPLRYGGGPASRMAKYIYYFAVSRLSSRIVTVSHFSKRSIERHLRVTGRKVGVLRYPVDPQFVERVTALRERCRRREVVLYVGRFAPHKNLPRLISAFRSTAFYRRGGQLVIVGGTDEEVGLVRRAVAPSDAERIIVKPACSQDELEHLYATSRLLVMPSLEEGFGLPAWEAVTCGLPVCVSDGGSLPEVVPHGTPLFRADSIPAMAAAIDGGVATERVEPPDSPPLPQAFASQLIGSLPR